MKNLFSARRRTLAIQWNHQSFDYLLGDYDDKGVRIDAAGTIPWSNVGDEPDIAAALSETGISSHLAAGRPNVVVAAARQHVDVFRWELPPAADQELPELVAHQVAMESELGETVQADFVPLDNDTRIETGAGERKARRVFGVVADETTIDRMRTSCSRAGLKLQRIAYSPTSTASLLSHTTGQPTQHALLISLRDQDAHLSICEHGELRDTRSFVLSSDNEGQLSSQLAIEIKRSIAIDPELNHCYLYGNPDKQAGLAARISQDVGVEVSVVNPFESVHTKDCTIPDDLGRFAPLVGIFYDAWKSTPGIDLLNPRQPPQPTSLRRRIALYAAATSIVLSLAGYYAYDQRARSGEELAHLQGSLEGWQAKQDKLEDRHALVSAVRDWQESNVIWLDEMRALSDRFPAADRARVRKMSMATTPTGGNVELHLQVRDSATISQLEQHVRDTYHQVNSKRISENAETSDFPWQFQTTISIQTSAGDPLAVSQDTADVTHNVPNGGDRVPSVTPSPSQPSPGAVE